MNIGLQKTTGEVMASAKENLESLKISHTYGNFSQNTAPIHQLEDKTGKK